MPIKTLNSLAFSGKLLKCTLTVRNPDSANKRSTIFGADVAEIHRDAIGYLGGETGTSIIRVSAKDILEIVCEGRYRWLPRKRIEKIYPRK